MAKKLGKKARKFAKKNLQSVMKRKRKLNSMYKKKSVRQRVTNEDSPENKKKLKDVPESQGHSEEMILGGSVSNNHLDDLFMTADDSFDDVSESDGCLSEDPECPYISGNEDESCPAEKSDDVLLLDGNREVHQMIVNQKRKLDQICAKDPNFLEFLRKHRPVLWQSRSEEIYTDDEGDGNSINDDNTIENKSSHSKVLTSSTVDVWCWLAIEQPNGPVLANLLNGFRVACHYGVNSDEVPSQKIVNREVYSKILTFVLCEAEGIFCRLLGISGSLNKDYILKMMNKSEMKTARQLIKSFLRSSLFLLNQEMDSQILVFILSQLRSSLMFFAAFPSLTKKLIKISIHLWATGDESLSACSFVIIRDIASKYSSDYLDACLTHTYAAFIANCKFMESANFKHIEFLVDTIVELYSLHIQKSYQRALVSIQKFSNTLRQAVKTKKKDELSKMQSWQYINCVSMWAKFISCNYNNYDLQPLLFLIVGVIRGITHVFPGLRYLPLKFRCVKMLNQLSLSCGVFIPVASLLFDCLELRVDIKADRTQQKHADFSLLLKVPKQLLRTREFAEASILCVIELLSEHFSQWCHHVSFPELATIPLILLKRFYESTTTESMRKPVKRLIEQVQQNSDFIQRKRDEVSFSPKDQPLVDNFLQHEKYGRTAPFSRFNAGMLETSLSRKTVT